jgi:hypothetical protein
MSSFDKERRGQSHLEFQAAATETQVVLAWGEDILDRVHELAHGIEEQVQRLLEADPDVPSSPSPQASDQSPRPWYPRDNKAGSEYPVDDPSRCW